MLVEFSVENFLSIKEKVTLQMEATSDKMHPSNLISSERNNKHPLLATAIIYGANASGKSNFINAFEFLESMVLFSHTYTPGTKIPVVPFKLDNNLDPTNIEMTFIYKNIKYHYFLSVTQERVIEEYLYFYDSRKPSLVFHRTKTKKYKFGKEQSFLTDISKKTNENSLFLTTSAIWNYPPSEKAFKWFSENLIVATNTQNPLWLYRTSMMVKENPEFKEKVLSAIKSADFGIFDIRISEREEDSIKKETPSLLKSILRLQKPLNIEFAHSGRYNNEDITVQLSLEEESGGTRRYFELLGPIIDALDSGKTIVIDEFDTSIHPLLLKQIIEMFRSSKKNKNKAQLIFTTHATSLLDSDIFRRDQIWFTEKRTDGSTSLYSLSDFDIRKDANFEKGYLIGRYGAIPFLSPGSLFYGQEISKKKTKET